MKGEMNIMQLESSEKTNKQGITQYSPPVLESHLEWEARQLYIYFQFTLGSN